MRHLAALVLVMGAPLAAGVDVNIGREAIERALALARSGEAARRAFHDRYSTRTGDPTFERFEIITELRRVVLFAEERIALGDRTVGATAAESALRPQRGRVTIVAHLRFHPQNAFVTLPEYEIRIGANPRQPQIPAISTRRDPMYPVGTALPAPNEPMIGARVEAVFDATAVGSTLRYVFLEERDKILVQAPIDFRILE